MEHCSPQRYATNTEADSHDTHILHGRVRQESFVVVRAAQEHSTHSQRQDTYKNQDMARPHEYIGVSIERVDAHDRYEARVNKRRRDKCRGGGGSSIVGIDTHGVEWEDLHLTAVTHNHKQECDLEVEGVARNDSLLQRCVVQGAMVGYGSQEHDAEVCHGDTRRADKDILPCSLQRLLELAVVDDTRRADCRSLKEYPCHGDVVRVVDTCDSHGKEHKQRIVCLI